ncbi:unnamed protein product [Leptosia nina]|uniref:Uncharacterized protein n=1 Tax=Leptosia nina TaxID=320188 RepID=A0AAV1IU04_9NEOP
MTSRMDLRDVIAATCTSITVHGFPTSTQQRSAINYERCSSVAAKLAAVRKDLSRPPTNAALECNTILHKRVSEGREAATVD